MVQLYRDEYATINRGAYSLSLAMSNQYEKARVVVAKFINADPSELVFTGGTTIGLNNLARSLGQGLIAGDEILISEYEHHANIVPWQQLLGKGLAIKVVPSLSDGSIDQQAYERLLQSGKVKIVALAHISNVLGVCAPLQKLAALARSKGALVVVDGAQAAPHMPVDVKELGVDFYLFSGHKVYGPTGVGALYGRKELLDVIPPFNVGGDMVESVSYTSSQFKAAPYKHEAGTPPFVQAIAMAKAIEFLDSLDMSLVAEHGSNMARCLYYYLSKITSVNVINSNQVAPLISFTSKAMHHFDIASLLSSNNIAVRSGFLCAEPLIKGLGYSGVVRASCGVYTTEEDIATFAKELAKVINY